MVKTADQEAYEKNFRRDIEKLANEVVIELNNNMPRDKQFEMDSEMNSYILVNCRVFCLGKKNSDRFCYWIYPVSEGDNSPNMRWEIWLIAQITKKGRLLPIFTKIPVTHNERYTKQELERAKNSIITKVLEELNRQNLNISG